jgi:hypothetical protein
MNERLCIVIDWGAPADPLDEEEEHAASVAPAARAAAATTTRLRAGYLLMRRNLLS